MNRELSPGPSALAICGLVVLLLLSIWYGIAMIIGATVWHFAEQRHD
ncbi:hypothetical protein QFZ60_001552 [Arthrobacter sp. B2I5]|nr:hypothetical protein [Arthrobacter sp. B2I5]MDQ0825379.1 hypothetical protein [Arthrobacter sp. B2I5]